ncbi:hypothetical protein EIN_333930 [Entamoeba invadens IP1]|uniref:MD-2-related lipid-recognition domain-containing protein n=1 Tax=Entamoeba invadens IP1 TaxID=370355 RepID=A0A0A1UB62_ENTIV|nr:hypothetical protein EIN_333930 [Entamoeba invadens IP1]ELP92426.1 hypothetical protein EIN_333930 [Entamoeba invadens IP1]|eukprot:XP_004259197.1 hypothetical protein EIN_333930 [Entamoeba invadens IP1]
MMFLCVLIFATTYAQPGTIDVKQCPDIHYTPSILINKLEYDQYPYLDDTTYMFKINVTIPTEKATMTWFLEYYWGTLYIASYGYEDVDLCGKVPMGCPLTIGEYGFSAEAKVKDVALAGWYLLNIHFSTLIEEFGCYQGWIYLY